MHRCREIISRGDNFTNILNTVQCSESFRDAHSVTPTQLQNTRYQNRRPYAHARRFKPIDLSNSERSGIPRFPRTEMVAPLVRIQFFPRFRTSWAQIHTCLAQFLRRRNSGIEVRSYPEIRLYTDYLPARDNRSQPHQNSTTLAGPSVPERLHNIKANWQDRREP